MPIHYIDPEHARRSIDPKHNWSQFQTECAMRLDLESPVPLAVQMHQELARHYAQAQHAPVVPAGWRGLLL